jgi:transposase
MSQAYIGAIEAHCPNATLVPDRLHTVKALNETVVSFIDTQVTNAIAEGINRVVGMANNRASGYRHLDAFSDMIYLAAGDPDLPEQIPKWLRTL